MRDADNNGNQRSDYIIMKMSISTTSIVYKIWKLVRLVKFKGLNVAETRSS